MGSSEEAQYVDTNCWENDFSRQKDIFPESEFWEDPELMQLKQTLETNDI